MRIVKAVRRETRDANEYEVVVRFGSLEQPTSTEVGDKVLLALRSLRE